MVPSSLLVALLAACQGAWGATFTVNKVADSGAGSLREAILDANAAGGPDTILFAPGLAGKTISPLTPLPDIGAGTTIDGDIDGNGAPDVRLRGASQSTGSGLRITGNDCRIYGLSIVAFPSNAINVTSVTGTVIQKCHLGADLAGAALGCNGSSQVFLYLCNDSTIGGAGKLRNVIGAGPGIFERGITLSGGSNNVIAGNYVGVTRNGQAALGSGDDGIVVSGAPAPGEHNYIGSAGGPANVFGGLSTGLAIMGTERLIVRNNLFGLTSDGDKVLPISYADINLDGASADITIGGASPSARNVFAGGDSGISFWAASSGTRVLGNWFGTNGDGTEARRLQSGIGMFSSSTAITIGGSTPAAGNYFTPNIPGIVPVGCYIVGGSGTTVRNNYFGTLPSGDRHAVAGTGVSIQTRVYVEDNDFAGVQSAVVNIGANADGRVYGNRFRDCYAGVFMYDGQLRLGNLSNASSDDDGGNIFKASNTYAIWNDTATNIRAEGNRFDSTLKADIDAKIRDHKDDPTLGWVDYNPLSGGVIPTGSAENQLAVTGAAALPTASGAEIAFTLSAPAEVSLEVLNLAGRPVAHPVAAYPLPAGLARLSWSGLADAGTAVPAGQYLIRIRARSDSGAETSALAPLGLRR